MFPQPQNIIIGAESKVSSVGCYIKTGNRTTKTRKCADTVFCIDIPECRQGMIKKSQYIFSLLTDNKGSDSIPISFQYVT